MKMQGDIGKHRLLIVIAIIAILCGGGSFYFQSSHSHRGDLAVPQGVTKRSVSLLALVTGCDCTLSQTETFAMRRAGRGVLLWHVECHDSVGNVRAFVNWSVATEKLVALKYNNSLNEERQATKEAQAALSGSQAARVGQRWLRQLALVDAEMPRCILVSPVRAGKLWRMTAETPTQHFNVSLDARSGQLISLESSY